MLKALIDGEWVKVNTAVVDDGAYLAQKAALENLRVRKTELSKEIESVVDSMAKTSHSSLSLAKQIQNSSYYSAQGGCMDDTYIYVYLRKSGTVSTSTTGAIVKLKRSDYSTVKTVTGLTLYHGNDMTYNSKDGYIYVATMHQADGKTRIDVIDRDTLTVVASKYVSFYISAIAYDKTRDVFVGAYGGLAIYLFKPDENGEFKLLKQLNTSSPAYSGGSYSSQGITCDGAFIYHAWSNAPAWRIEIYDWSGKYHGAMTGSTEGKEIEWLEKLSASQFMTGMHTIGGGGYCTIYTFTAT